MEAGDLEIDVVVVEVDMTAEEAEIAVVIAIGLTRTIIKRTLK